ncbi:GDSL-type esterase/lipase family protein [Paraflavitalea sp. CAU 1676]|uniref:GDSL-type esterase/lipase family protein n=1 Tax=Paraflavitalea sp. CAU 1676 TaxID=3032598 RepID=UPI0023DBB6A7|nr:GDSL-type esterase/lipase family protein [Paraflavitalea sp. CAU 1676]MDF2193237.1 GDSL-type esterase/lipase family protein [Paraflavitalea sp. CAU 1676]
MKKLILVTLLSGVASICTVAQSTSATANPAYRPGAYALKAAQFKSYPNSAKDIIFLGNSITAGTDWAELLGNPNARNRGISGDITYGILARLEEVTEGKPAKVFLLIGINDIQHNTPDSIIIANYRQIVQTIKAASPHTKIHVQTLLPVNNTFTQFKNHYNKDEHIAAVNEGIRKIAAEEKVTCIELNKPFQDAEGKLDKRYTMDGLHLTADGYKVWAGILKPYL